MSGFAVRDGMLGFNRIVEESSKVYFYNSLKVWSPVIPYLYLGWPGRFIRYSIKSSEVERGERFALLLGMASPLNSPKIG